ncbi:ABC transporter substrate-binding protein [Pseudoduganella sp. DS3]|uniref:ABC transporter substrate-binding protein n=1 Tax=Pseudoduganella guangdongensis TaxID=2692179 RepID=A0A6N9HGI2_9BURK|nr:hemin ABC transporter substrate-binding protein [Pseudoduganella guangdongensis]MYN02546.1 ABC transporter substrate-binding protein [Pseudoduganella guangdongensis]
MPGLTNPARRAHLAQFSALLLAGLMPAAHAAAANRRIVAVGGALTEIMYALQAQGELVGVDTTSQFPAAASKLPNVGYARTLSAEGVLALAPTHIIASEEAGPPTVLKQIAAAGVPLSVLPANHRFEGLVERVQRVGEIVERKAQAAQLVQSLQQEWARVTAQVQAQLQARGGKGPKVLFIMSHAPGQAMVSGTETSADAMLRYAGASNAITGFTGYKPLTPEAVIAAQPDVILLTEQGLQVRGGVPNVLAMPGIGQTPAGRARRVVALEAMQLLGFGPRLPSALAALDAALTKAMAA